MKKQQPRAARRTPKPARVADLAPKAQRRSDVKAGATTAFMTPQVLTIPTTAAAPEKWIELNTILF